MKVVFASNYLNHHQLPFCLAMQELLGPDFTFIATERVSEDRIAFGYREMDKEYSFVITTYDHPENLEKTIQLAEDADVMMIGSAPDFYISRRLKKNKLTFKYQERLYKDKIRFSTFIHMLAKTFKHHGRFQLKPIYMLCASYYTAGDCALFGNYWNRTYKWGYFPEVTSLNIEELFLLKKKNTEPKILWAGRFIEWKHPEYAVLLAEKLKDTGISFHLDMIGSGERQEIIRTMIADHGLENAVSMLGAMEPEAVRLHMQSANIFLFTSDYAEGWGAVLNESMNSGCAVVASNAIGAAGFLIDNRINGYIYRNQDQNDLNRIVLSLLSKPDEMERVGRAAYQTMAEEWNGKMAAVRLIKLSEYLMQGHKGSPFTTGPCSVAQRISNKKAEKILCK